MPIYEYECPVCGVIEVMQGINEKPLAKCPSCHRRKVKKLISESCFQLKGSGWYATDYAGKGNGNGGNGKASKHSETETSSTSKSTTPSDSPAKTPDSGAKPDSTAT